MSQSGWVLAWRTEGAASEGALPNGAPAAPDSTKIRRETSQVEMLLVSHRGMVAPFWGKGRQRGRRALICQGPRMLQLAGCF